MVGCRRNPLLAAPLTLEGFAAAGHVAVQDRRPQHLRRERTEPARDRPAGWKSTPLRSSRRRGCFREPGASR